MTREPSHDTDPRRLTVALARLARAALGAPAPDGRLGEIRLLPHQRDGVHRIRAAIDEFGGALLADEVGLGKTFIALAVARHYPFVDIVAPAALLPMWNGAIHRTAMTQCALHSLHRLSLDGETAWDRRPAGGLVIVDEAHGLRNHGTRRYQRVARGTVGRHVLLLSATPVHNRSRELAAQLALFLGSRADAIDDTLLQRLVVRRRHGTDVTGARLPRVVRRRLDVERIDEPTRAALQGMPPPVATVDGDVARALVESTLRRAWASSEAALDSALRRRLLRGRALRDVLTSGAVPTRRELRAWTVGDDAGQLAFSELLAVEGRGGSEREGLAASELLPALDRHLEWAEALVRDRARRGVDDAERIALLDRLLTRHDGVPIVAFSHFAETVRALHRGLRRRSGVALLTASSARIASGPILRAELLALFAPIAQRSHSLRQDARRAHVPEHMRIRLLLATDLLAEGVNLQDAGAVVHLDLPWTDALLRQRVGRVARLSSPHDVVHAYVVRAPPVQLRALRVVERLLRKASVSRRLVGTEGSPCPGNDASAVDRASSLRAVLLSWCRDDEDAPPESESAVQVLVLPSSSATLACGLAVVHGGRTPQLLALEGADLMHADADSDRLLAICMEFDALVTRGAAGDRLVPAAPDTARSVAGAIDRWRDAHQARLLAGPSESALSATQRDAMRALSGCIAAVNASRRPALAGAIAAARAMIARAHAVGAEPALARWSSGAGALPAHEWLERWRSDAVLARLEDATDGERGSAGETCPGDEPGARDGLVFAILLAPSPRPGTQSQRGGDSEAGSIG